MHACITAIILFGLAIDEEVPDDTTISYFRSQRWVKPNSEKSLPYREALPGERADQGKKPISILLISSPIWQS
jgi:hypothetical protein